MGSTEEDRRRKSGSSRRTLLFSSVAALGTATLATGSRAETSAARNGLARSSHGMVTSPHELASQAGQEVLQAGGNAIEAAIAINATLCVTYPHFCGLGGDAFMIISDREGNGFTLSGIGQAAAKPPNYGGPIPVRGPGSALTAAAAVDTWDQAFEFSRRSWDGRQSWKALFKRAIQYASEGFPLTPSQRFWSNFRANEIGNWPDVVRVFTVDGRIPDVGETFRQPDLARTLTVLAENGGRDFYTGDLALRIARGLQQAGSPLTANDLARCRARNETALRVSYRGGELVSLRPPTQGIATLEIMGTLDRLDLAAIPEGSADYYHVLVEAVKTAFIDRNRYVADPDFVDVPVNRLLSKVNLDAHAKSIDMRRAAPWPYVFKPGDTVFIGAVDRDGNCVSMLQTVYFDWGSGVVAGDTGILWHNRGASFSMDPQHINVLQPGKRPFHTLNPGMYFKEGRPRLLYGTQGADGQPQTLAAVLTRLIDYKMDPLSALTRPRFLLGKTFSDSRDSLKLELDAGQDVFAELAVRGHEISPIPAQSPLAGHPGAIRIETDGSLVGAHDPRSDGLALGI
ncbi:gamma-glutamyltransferase family protein [Methylobacterium oxalidis]|uniref:Gamma-glutamyltransferase n=1 Tax=Methylobacterium oxalidis TaxID=944322 RepID=A0ABQ6DNW3_9HYPH|nr:gamma-glutamyltransferase family protein [Methylobacterium oxalidis]GJE30331.1 Glutathione hydrolase-like YwrD proenzyme [Methylobacterium oxalidis]GLS65813.1 gamma-glutamyltransferase [Methylobacterium oxalidis]